MRRALQEYGPLMAFVLLLIVYAIWQPGLFFNLENWKNLINQNAAVGILAIGMTLVIIGGGIDLSVGSMLAVTACLGILLLNKQVTGGASEGVAVMAGVAGTIVAGAVLGLINGLVITTGRVAPFIATLVGLVAFRSMALSLADGGEIRSQSANVFPALGTGGISLPFIQLGNNRVLVITWAIVAFFLIALIAGFLLNKTRYGRRLVAVGANEKAAIYSAVNVDRVKLVTYGLMGLLTGIAAVFSAARFNSVTSSQMGLYYELDAIAAVVIGGTRMTGGKGRIWGTVIGVLMLGLITNMLVTSGISVYWQGFVKGIIILLAVLIQRGQSES
jgi:ribose transport system permease protein